MIEVIKGIFSIIGIWIEGFKDIQFFDLGFSFWDFIVGIIILFFSVFLFRYIFSVKDGE